MMSPFLVPTNNSRPNVPPASSPHPHQGRPHSLQQPITAYEAANMVSLIIFNEFL